MTPDMPHIDHFTDVAIIGAGPVGLFAIFECGMMRMKCHVIDTLDMVGGQCAALYPEKPIYDIPGYPQIMAQDLIKNLQDQAAPFDPVYHLGCQVISLIQYENKWSLTLSNGITIVATAVIIAAGVGAFGPNRPPLHKIEQYEGKSVLYYIKSREQFRDRTIMIAGGGDSAVDWAISLSDIAKKVMVIHRRPKFRCAPESESRLNHLVETGKIDLIIPYQLDQLTGHDGILESVTVKTLEGENRILKTDYLLPFFGLAMNIGPIAEWKLNLERNHIAINPATCQTNLPGIFAIGDIATYSHKMKLILTGFSEAALAAQSARSIIYPNQAWHFEYSTTQGLPEVQKS